MIDPYTAVALSPRTIACGRREDISRNIKHILGFIDVAYGVAATEGPTPRLITIPEWTLQGPYLNFRQGDRQREAELAVTIPGPETEEIGSKAKELNVYIAGELYLVRDESFPDRYFNVAFIVGPSGDVIYQRAKTIVADYEPDQMGTTCPHDVWDQWVDIKGGGDVMDAVYPVVDTDIGKIGIVICMEGGYPEIARGLALNGAEILIRMTYQDPFVNNGWWELQNRSHSMFNNVYVVAPNVGPQQMSPDGPLMDVCGGGSMITDYMGRVLASRPFVAADTMVSATLELESLRQFRSRIGLGNNLKDLRTEQFAPIYERTIYPKNQHLDKPPQLGALDREFDTRRSAIEALVKQGIVTPPSQVRDQEPSSGVRQ